MNGARGIRTHDTVAGIPPFQGGAFSHSARAPKAKTYTKRIQHMSAVYGHLANVLPLRNMLTRPPTVSRVRHTLSRRHGLCRCTRKVASPLHLKSHALPAPHDPTSIVGAARRIVHQTYTARTRASFHPHAVRVEFGPRVRGYLIFRGAVS